MHPYIYTINHGGLLGVKSGDRKQAKVNSHHAMNHLEQLFTYDVSPDVRVWFRCTKHILWYRDGVVLLYRDDVQIFISPPIFSSVHSRSCHLFSVPLTFPFYVLLAQRWSFGCINSIIVCLVIRFD